MYRHIIKKKNQFLDWLISEKSEISKATLYTHRRFVEAILLALVASIMGLVFKLMGIRENFPIELSILVCVIVLWMYRAYVFIGFFFIALTYDLFTNVDEILAYFRWYVVLPMFALFFINRNSGLFWGGVILISTLGLYSYDFPNSAILSNPENKKSFFSDTITYYLTVIILIYIYYRGKEVISAQLIQERKEIKNKANDLLIMKDQLLEKNSELQTYAHVVSHDLKTPLRGILGFSEILKNELTKNKTLGEESGIHLDFIKNNALQMEELITDILRYSELSNNTSKEFKLEDLNDLLKQAISSFPNKQIKESVIIHQEELPYVPVLKTQTKQIFQNLISNSIKFTDKNRPLRIEITTKDYPNLVMFTFKDNGIGVKNENLEYMFLPFKRLNSQSRYNGSGIGLANCEKVVKRHKGTIWAESELGKGLTVSFTLSKKPQ
jgi:signal transduction histidine kinase